MKHLIVAFAFLAICSSCSDEDNNLEQEGKFTITYPDMINGDNGKLKITCIKSGEEQIISPPYSTYDFDPGEYLIEELQPPNGYEPNINPIRRITIHKTSPNTLLFRNVPSPAGQQSLYYENRTSGGQFLVGANYNGIRIGEYYWMDCNMNHTEPAWLWWTATIGDATNFPITQPLLDKYLKQVSLDHTKFQIDPEIFDKYYGKYYDWTTINYMNQYAKMYEGSERNTTGWEHATIKDFRQLFAMCPFRENNTNYALGVLDVHLALSCSEGDNPMTEYTISGDCGATYWFDKKYTSNLYGFNMMPGGARINRVTDGQTTPWYTNLCGASKKFDAVTGDLYHLFYTAKWRAKDGYISIHDNLDTGTNASYHWQNVRWCRRLTDEELGYKLYITTQNSQIRNSEIWTNLQNKNDIPLLRKIRKGEYSPNDFDIIAFEYPSPDHSAPEGAIELPNGYLRGFYVQYFTAESQRNKTTIKNKEVTLSDIITFAANIDDHSLK